MNLETLYTLGQNSVIDFRKFALFVSYTERLIDANVHLCDEQFLENIEAAWFDMEIINALALSDWEEQGNPCIWNGWEQNNGDGSSYFLDAKKAVDIFFDVLKNYNNNFLWLKWNG